MCTTNCTFLDAIIFCTTNFTAYYQQFLLLPTNFGPYTLKLIWIILVVSYTISKGSPGFLTPNYTFDTRLVTRTLLLQ